MMAVFLLHLLKRSSLLLVASASASRRTGARGMIHRSKEEEETCIECQGWAGFGSWPDGPCATL